MVKRVLNLYCGIGGNRKLWKDVDVIAIEIDPKIAAIYQDFFPDDTVIVTDAHQYLLEHYKDGWDFIWSSPPCPTHSRIRKYTSGGRFKAVYPDAKLWQEIIFLSHYYNGLWSVENVQPYYELLIIPGVLTSRHGRHVIWSNFSIATKNMPPEIRNTKHRYKPTDKQKYFKGVSRQLYRNAVHPALGQHIFNCAFKVEQHTLYQEAV